MEENISALHSAYVIDGVRESVTPARILGGISRYPADDSVPEDSFPPVVDETVEVDPTPVLADPRKVEKYLAAVQKTVRSVPMAFSGQYTRLCICRALLDSIWKLGRFRLGDLGLNAEWCWNADKVGNMAAFYRSAEAAGEFLDNLNLGLLSYNYKTADGPCSMEFSAELRPVGDEEELVEQPFTTPDPRMGAASISGTFLPDESSWIVYIPFDAPSYRLGGSLLAQALEINPPLAPQTDDADYFIDCYEVVRELVEDGIVLSGATVADGGLLAALKGMASSKTGAVLDVSDVRRASPGTDMVSLLFSEVPGVIVQIRDIDFDYIDAELLLQDVAFYPLGHPVANGGSVRVKASAKSGIQNILESLVRRQGGEGED